MQQQEPSRTAIGTALQRAAHLMLDGDPKILVDKFAGPFAGYTNNADIQRALDAYGIECTTDDMARLRTVFALRHRYAEDQLAEALRRGITQYVILGAGLDSFAYRRPERMASLNVFEVDHPASQAWKRARIAELGITSPAHLHYVPIDFEQQTLAAGLAASSVNLTAPVFFSWLGLAQYLTSDAVLRMLRDIVTITVPGSELVIQYIVPPAMLAAEEAALLNASAARAASRGEHWHSFFEPAEMEHHLVEAGFGEIVHFGPAQATERYLRGRTDALRLPAYFNMIKAQVR